MCRDGAREGPAGGLPDETAAGSLTGAVDLLEAAAGALSGLDPERLDGGEMREQLCRAHKVLQQVEAGVVWVADAYRVDGTWRESGLRSPASELAHRTGGKKADFWARFLLGKGLRENPKVDEALRGGDIDLGRAEVLCGLARSRRYADAYGESEDLLVSLAQGLDRDHFDKAIVEWKKKADPDGAIRDAQDDHDARYVKLTTGLRGLGILEAVLKMSAGSG